jgi:hypothetical protein
VQQVPYIAALYNTFYSHHDNPSGHNQHCTSPPHNNTPTPTEIPAPAHTPTAVELPNSTQPSVVMPESESLTVGLILAAPAASGGTLPVTKKASKRGELGDGCSEASEGGRSGCFHRELSASCRGRAGQTTAFSVVSRGHCQCHWYIAIVVHNSVIFLLVCRMHVRIILF